LVVVFSLLLGALIGSWIGIEEKLEKESQDLEARIKADSKRLSQQSPAVKNPTSKPLKKDSELSLESK